MSIGRTPAIEIKVRLEVRNWTQRELAKVLGRDPADISAIMTG
jgi:plasmid maintenance system antidote protein VapI